MSPLLQFCKKNPQFSCNIFGVFAVNFFCRKTAKAIFCAKRQKNLPADVNTLVRKFILLDTYVLKMQDISGHIHFEKKSNIICIVRHQQEVNTESCTFVSRST